MRSVLLLAIALCLVSAAVHASEAHVVAFEGPIGPVALKFIAGAIERAEDEGAVCLVIELDTPGGLDTSMRGIIQDVIASKVPVVIYVHPIKL